MVGAAQERWLIDGWRASDAVWNLVPQQVTFCERRSTSAADYKVSMDAWDGARPPATGCWRVRRRPAPPI